MTHNVNQFLERGALDVSLNKTTWSSGLYFAMYKRLRAKNIARVDNTPLMLIQGMDGLLEDPTTICPNKFLCLLKKVQQE